MAGGSLALVTLPRDGVTSTPPGSGAPPETGRLAGQLAEVRAVSPSFSSIAPVQTFVTRPDLRPPVVTVTSYGPPSPSSPPYVFLSVRNYLASAPSQSGLMILDRLGRLVWFMPVANAPFNFSAQSYQGHPVLTWWQGNLLYDYGQGTNEVADTSYTTRHTIRAGHGLTADLHELVLTSRGTALITCYQTVNANLSSAGGSTKGQVVGGHVQEIDITSGKVLFDWNSLGPIAYSESYVPAPKSGPYDYFHINSADLTPDGNLLISAKNTWALYKVDRSNGKLLWRMNGKRSNWKMALARAFIGSTTLAPPGQKPSACSTMARQLRASPRRPSSSSSTRRAWKSLCPAPTAIAPPLSPAARAASRSCPMGTSLLAGGTKTTFRSSPAMAPSSLTGNCRSAATRTEHSASSGRASPPVRQSRGRRQPAGRGGRLRKLERRHLCRPVDRPGRQFAELALPGWFTTSDRF